MKGYSFQVWTSIIMLILLLPLTNQLPAQSAADKSGYQQMVDFFFEWRKFHAPEMKDGVPDYSAAAMQKQYQELAGWQQRLAAIDTSGWPVAHQIDWYLIWTEMNGLDFAHRVKKPWSRDPAFYVWYYPNPTDVPEREAPNIHGNIEYDNYAKPLSPEDAADMTQRLGNIAVLYQQARKNLTGNARDLWVSGIRSIKRQSSQLAAIADEMQKKYPKLAKAAGNARTVSDKFAEWLSDQAPAKTGTSGVGKENYTWNLRNVHLLPYSWEDQVLIMRRELDRSHSSLRLEEHRNRKLPKLKHIATAEEYDRLLNEAVDEFMAFLEREEILPMKDYMDPALRERMGKFTPAEGLRGFFAEITYRDALVMRTHHYHWFDLAMMRDEPHKSPIRRTPLFYNIFDGRAEGMATGMEEMMMHAGLFDKRPRARELVWILLAQRAARGLGGLYQHGLEMTLQQAADFASKWTPWGLLPADGATIQWEEHFYLRQPAYGTSYVIGKIEIERLIAEYARQREGEFVLSQFLDAFNKTGVIPVSLIFWELTEDKSMLNAALMKGKNNEK